MLYCKVFFCHTAELYAAILVPKQLEEEIAEA